MIKLVERGGRRGSPRRSQAQRLDQGTRYLWLKNLQNLDEEEKASIARLEAAIWTPCRRGKFA